MTTNQLQPLASSSPQAGSFEKLERVAGRGRAGGVMLHIFGDVYAYLQAQFGPAWPHLAEKAFFAAWLASNHPEKKPKTRTALAKLLGVRRLTLNDWQNAAWFEDLQIGHLRRRRLLGWIDDVDARTVEAALFEEGSPGVQSRRLYYEITGLASAGAVVNVAASANAGAVAGAGPGMEQSLLQGQDDEALELILKNLLAVEAISELED